MANFKITEQDNKVIVKGIQDFDLKHAFECGQCFRWGREDDGSYTGVVFSKVINLKQKGDIVIIDNCSMQDFNDLWYHYFDFKRDYSKIKKTLSDNDPIMAEAIRFGQGIRILNQDEWETIISFILSQNRSIPLIKKSIEEISQRYGEFICYYKERKYYAFPTPEVLAEKSAEELAECKMGYRTRYIIETAKAILNMKDIYRWKELDPATVERKLLELCGVGPKVANCIMLYSMNKYERFPVDVWVKRIMTTLYPSKCKDVNAIYRYADEKYGAYGGFAQQYLFYYARENGIGK